MADAASPLVCNMDALGPPARERHAVLTQVLRERCTTTTEIDQGYTLGFEVDDVGFLMLAEWMTLEQRCCSFLDFSLELGRDGVLLRMTGPEGTPAFLREELGFSADGFGS